MKKVIAAILMFLGIGIVVSCVKPETNTDKKPTFLGSWVASYNNSIYAFTFFENVMTWGVDYQCLGEYSYSYDDSSKKLTLKRKRDNTTESFIVKESSLNSITLVFDTSISITLQLKKVEMPNIEGKWKYYSGSGDINITDSLESIDISGTSITAHYKEGTYLYKQNGESKTSCYVCFGIQRSYPVLGFDVQGSPFNAGKMYFSVSEPNKLSFSTYFDSFSALTVSFIKQ